MGGGGEGGGGEGGRAAGWDMRLVGWSGTREEVAWWGEGGGGGSNNANINFTLFFKLKYSTHFSLSCLPFSVH